MPECQPLPNKRFGRLSQIESCKTGMHPHILTRMLSTPLLKLACLPMLNQLLLGDTEKASIKHVDCQLQTLSEIIREQNIEKIDLLKIDAEGSELDIVMGIDINDWKKIKQLVVEVHDIDGRLQKMISLLEGYGYRTLVGQPDWEVHKLMNVFSIYAVTEESIVQS
jgi:hypothetical protein